MWLKKTKEQKMMNTGNKEGNELKCKVGLSLKKNVQLDIVMLKETKHIVCIGLQSVTAHA